MVPTAGVGGQHDVVGLLPHAAHARPHRNRAPVALYVMEASCAVRFVFLIGYIELTADEVRASGEDARLANAEGTARVEDQESGSREPRNRE